MRDLLMTFNTFKKYCKLHENDDSNLCDSVYQHQYIGTPWDKRCQCKKRNCPVVKRTRL